MTGNIKLKIESDKKWGREDLETNKDPNFIFYIDGKFIDTEFNTDKEYICKLLRIRRSNGDITYIMPKNNNNMEIHFVLYQLGIKNSYFLRLKLFEESLDYIFFVSDYRLKKIENMNNYFLHDRTTVSNYRIIEYYQSMKVTDIGLIDLELDIYSDLEEIDINSIHRTYLKAKLKYPKFYKKEI